MIATCQGHAPGAETFPPMISPILNSETVRLVIFTPQDTEGGGVVVGGSVGAFLSRAVPRKYHWGRLVNEMTGSCSDSDEMDLSS